MPKVRSWELGTVGVLETSRSKREMREGGAPYHRACLRCANYQEISSARSPRFALAFNAALPRHLTYTIPKVSDELEADMMNKGAGYTMTASRACPPNIAVARTRTTPQRKSQTQFRGIEDLWLCMLLEPRREYIQYGQPPLNNISSPCRSAPVNASGKPAISIPGIGPGPDMDNKT